MADLDHLAADNGRRKLITAPTVSHEGVSLGAFLVVWLVSTFVNLVMLGILGGTFFMLGKLTAGEAPAQLPPVKSTAEVDAVKNELDLTNTDIGEDTNTELAFNNDRIEELSTPGKVDPGEQVGVPDAPSTVPQNTPPPPGGGSLGTGAAVFDPNTSGLGASFGDLGGYAGSYVAGGFAGRSGSTKKKLLAFGGGNKESEAAVAAGLEWLALHQCADGRWSLHQFNRHARTAPLPGGKVVPDNSEAGVARSDDTGGTALGLLPFLAAGITPKSKPDQNMKDYRKGVEKGLNWLVANQAKSGATRGSFGGPDMYSQGLATIAMCEAYALTADSRYKASAQLALDYIVMAQHAGGGWRYRVKEKGDLSVTGWQVMALRSGQMAGLKVNKKVLKDAEGYLKSVAGDDKGSYKYTEDAPNPSAAMTAVGALCLQYMNVPRRNEFLQGAVSKIKQVPPAMSDDSYYLYYATQVMHHMGEKDWDFWNLGPKGDGKGGIRDTLIARQDKGLTKKAHKGSFSPRSFHDGGRLGATAMNLLSLEVYYRHLPLYKDMTGK